MKTYEEIQKEVQARIDKQVKKKEFRQTKTELNINFSWAVNNSTASLTEEDKKDWTKAKRKIKRRFPWFIQLYRGWAIENIPIEPTERLKLTKEDFVEAKKEAPALQALQDKADEIGGQEKIAEEETERANELASVVVEPLEEEIQSPKDKQSFYRE